MPEGERKGRERPLLGPRAPPLAAPPEGARPSRISLPPSLPPSPSLASRSLCRAAGGESRSPQLETAARAPAWTLVSRSHFAPLGFQTSGARALGNRSQPDAFRRPRPAPAGTDLLISRTAGRGELNRCLPLLSPAVGGSFSKGTFYSLFSIFYRGDATRLGEQSLPCKRVFYVWMCSSTLDPWRRLRLSSRGTACYFGHPSPSSTWYPERIVTKLPAAPWTWIATGCKFGVQTSTSQEGLGPPRPRRQRLGKFTSGFSHVLLPLPRLWLTLWAPGFPYRGLLRHY